MTLEETLDYLQQDVYGEVLLRRPLSAGGDEEGWVNNEYHFYWTEGIDGLLEMSEDGEGEEYEEGTRFFRKTGDLQEMMAELTRITNRANARAAESGSALRVGTELVGVRADGTEFTLGSTTQDDDDT